MNGYKLMFWMIAGFLAARFVLFGGLISFALPLIVYVYMQQRKYGLMTALAAIGGASTLGWSAGETVLMQCLVLAILHLPLRRIRFNPEEKIIVYSILAVSLVRVIRTLLFAEFSVFQSGLLALEAFLAAAMAAALWYADPIKWINQQQLPASVEQRLITLAVTAVWVGGIHSISIKELSPGVMVAYAIVMFCASAGGVAAGGLSGFLLSAIPGMVLANPLQGIILLPVAGMLAGLLRKGGTFGIIAGFWLGALSVTVFSGGISLFELVMTLLAVTGLYLIVPESWERGLRHLYETNRTLEEEKMEPLHRIRSKAITRIRQFASMFRHMGMIFRHSTPELPGGRETVVEQSMRNVMERNCQQCSQYNQCWEQYFPQTVELIGDMIDHAGKKPEMVLPELATEWASHCIKVESVWNTLNLTIQHWEQEQGLIRQIGDSRNLAARQLYGVSEIMDQMAGQLYHERLDETGKLDQIQRSIQEAGIRLRKMQLISLSKGDVQIVIEHTYPAENDPCRTILAPVFSSILQDNICIAAEKCLDSNGILREVLFCSVKQFQLETGVSALAKRGAAFSGDSHLTMDYGDGLMAVAISDGMGNGQRAFQESSAALDVLKHLLQSGLDQKMAVRSVNSVLMLRSDDEMYATLDLACFDLNCGIVTILKNGSAPGFIKRGSELITISSTNLPLGIVPEIDVDVIRFQLIPGDLFILMSDGADDALGWMIDKDRYLRRLMAELPSEDPQQTAEWLMERIVGRDHRLVRDDITVVVVRAGRLGREWGTVHMPVPRVIGREKVLI